MNDTATLSQPIAITVTRYRCPHCPRSRARKQATTEHITRCWMNPANRTCKTCVHYQAPSTGPNCEPGHHCTCSDFDEACTREDGPEPNEFPVVACPLWEPRPGYEAVEPMVAPCIECGTELNKPQRSGMFRGQWLCDPCATPMTAPF